MAFCPKCKTKVKKKHMKLVKGVQYHKRCCFSYKKGGQNNGSKRTTKPKG